MKDYSNFFKNPHGFILNYTIENGEILVYTSKSKKGQPHRIPATPENIKEIESKLEKQYKMIIEHQDEIINYINDSKTKKHTFSLLVIGILSLICILGGPSIYPNISQELYLMTGVGATLSTVIIPIFLMNRSSKKLKVEMKTYEDFIKNMQGMEKQLENDINLTEYLSKSATDMIDDRTSSKQKGNLDTVLNIDFMDKTSLKDLRNMLLRYKISRGLESEQRFSIPTNKPKTRTRTPEGK